MAHDVCILVGFVSSNDSKVGLAHMLLVMQMCATGLSITLILGVALGGLGQHAAELYATPWKIVAFEKANKDPRSVSDSPGHYSGSILLAKLTAHYFSSNLLGLWDDEHQDVNSLLV